MAAAGATLEERLKWRMGLYPKWFMAEVWAWVEQSRLVQAHWADANAPKIK